MSRKRQFFPGGKDADSRPIGSFNLRFAWKDEGCFGKIHFTGQRLHLFVGQTTGVGEDGQWITRERRSSKNIKLNEIVAGAHIRKSCSSNVGVLQPERFAWHNALELD